MCAELLMIQWSDGLGNERAETVSLEDISEMGACLRSDYAILPNTEITLHYSSGKYLGVIKYCNYERSGFSLGVAFDEGYRWSKEDFEPAHLFEVPSFNE
jgi:hypothetical protein